MSRFRPWVLAVALASSTSAVVTLAPAARAEEAASDLAVGTQLMALDHVTLQRAEIAKGSKVSIAQLLTREGHIDGVSLELSDGHVVKVALDTIRNFFRVVDP